MTTHLWYILRAKALRDVLKEIDRLSDTDVESARKGAEHAIQKRRWIPGELRRWLCAKVRDIPASTAAEFKKTVRQMVERAI